MELRVITLALAALWNSAACTLLAAQESSVTILFEHVLGHDPDIAPKELWKRIIHSDFELSSLPEKRHGHFEFLHVGDKQSEPPMIYGAMLDDNGTRRVHLASRNENLASWLMIDELWLNVGSSAKWEQRNIKTWSFQVDDPDLATFLRLNNSPVEKGVGGFIKFGLSNYLGPWFEDETPSTRWDGATRTAAMFRSSGSSAEIRFRTPDDQRRFGTIISNLHMRGSKGGYICFSSFIVDRSSPLRLNIMDIESLPARLEAVDETGNADFPGFSQITTEDGRRVVRKLEREIALVCDDPREVQSPEFLSCFEEKLNGYGMAYERLIHPKLAAGQSFPQIGDFVDVFVSDMEIAYVSIQKAITAPDPTGDPIVDDPNILWLGFERAIMPRVAYIFFSHILPEICISEKVPVREKVKLCMAMGEFGAPAEAVSDPILPGSDGPFLSAVLHARWNWVPTKEEIALCKEKAAQEWPRPLEREAAIDSLIRWGHLNDVPANRLDEWLATKLAASNMQRHCTWKALTRTPSGREFLLSQWDSLAEHPEIQREVAEIFCHRARATLDMKRFDFMTENECHQALELCQPLAK